MDFEKSRNKKKSYKDGFKTFDSTLLNDNDLIEVGINKDIDALFVYLITTKTIYLSLFLLET